ncbi:sensor histidine kinase [Kocuria sp.]|uniref:sensor histidine kinase n=1 Tax=Kocuria sp. TaxID=1871328 RepID=UPI0026DFD15E|nr:ATP-binding protein [Kocuria sp.]MDO5617603.1 ATP-binding protein [Kocuria sp.]
MSNPRHWGVRLRATVTAALLLTAVVLVAGVAFKTAVETALTAQAREQVSAQLQRLMEATASDATAAPEAQPTSEAQATSEAQSSSEAQATQPAQATPDDGVSQAHLLQLIQDVRMAGETVQILRQGQVLDSVPDSALSHQVSVHVPELAPGETAQSAATDLRSHEVWAAGGVVVDGEDSAVVVLTEGHPELAVLEVVETVLLVGSPVAVIFGTALMWWQIGRALTPVRVLTREVARISRAREDARVEQPATADEVEELAVTMNHMLARLAQAEAQQRRFVADASHELRSPLATLRTTLEVTARQGYPDRWESVGPVLVGQVERMNVLVDDLLTLAKADDDGLALRCVDTDLDDVVATEIQRIAAGPGPHVVAHIEPIRITADPNRIQQVIHNLLVNARRHASTTVWVDVGRTGSHAHVSVVDDGRGIAPDQRERIFERFVRLDESRTRDTGGSGLGLAISRSIAEAHGGGVSCDVDPQGRTRFTVWLPGEFD